MPHTTVSPASTAAPRAPRKRLSLIAGTLRSAASLSLAEPELLGLGQLIRSGDICFDIGAAYGMYSFAMAHLAGQAGGVYSFEPQSKPRRIFRTGIRASGLRNIHVTRDAVGEHPGEVEMTLPVKFGIAPIHGHAHINDGVREHAVRTTSFTRTRSWRTTIRSVDEFCSETTIPRVDFMKVDAGGFEPNVVDGARKTIGEHQPTLLLEIENRHLSRYSTTAAEFTDTLRKLDYSMYTWNGREWVRAERVTPARRNYLFAVDSAPSR